MSKFYQKSLQMSMISYKLNILTFLLCFFLQYMFFFLNTLALVLPSNQPTYKYNNQKQ